MADAHATRFASLEKFVPVFLAVAVVCQALLYWNFMGACAGAADSSGYLNSARLLARGEFYVPIHPVAGINSDVLPGYVDEMYAPLGFRPMLRAGTMSPTYPIGLPLLLVAAAKVSSWDAAPGLTLLLHAMLGVLLMYALGREFGLSPGWASLGALTLGVSPLFHFMSLWTMSDVPALVWTTGGLLCAWRAQRRPAWALAAGFALGFAVLIRPTNVLALVPALIALGFGARRLLLFALGGLPAAAFLLRYNLGAYGGAFTSGYYNAPDSFAFHYVAPTLLHYARWLPVLLTPLVVAAFALPWARETGARAKLVLAAWILAFAGFYAIYSYTASAWWFLRFLLPAFPPLVVASLLALRGFAGRKPGRVPPAVAWTAVAAVIFLHGALWSRTLHALSSGYDETAYRTTTAWAKTHLPANAIIFAGQDSGAFFYYTDFNLVRADWLHPDTFGHALPALRDTQRPIYAVLQDFEAGEIFERHTPGRWKNIERVLNSTVWKFEP